MFKFKCKDTFYNLPPDAAAHILEERCDCPFEAEAETKHELIKKIVDHATEEHYLENRRLAPISLMDRVLYHIVEEK